MDEQKQQVIDTLKRSNNILVTVRSNPSIDQLSACIALTLIVNELGKHGTAVFSGQVPSVMEFLEPEKTLERTTDSLRDFIISLDKAKADKLRSKVEDTVVKVFITPYRASLSPQDLEFSQGDFNVDVVVALGVHNQDDLDEAITAHGRILHDATVVSINTEPGGGEDIGSVVVVDNTVSSLSELVATLAQKFDKDGLIDNQIATALLTGIIAETNRFSNNRTKPSTMEVAAHLLTAGANQELVSTKLAEPAPQPLEAAAPAPAPEPLSTQNTELPAQVPEQPGISPQPEPPKPDNGELAIDHPVDAPSETGVISLSTGFAQENADFEVPQDVQPVITMVGGHAEGRMLEPLTSDPAVQQPGEEQAALDFLRGRKVDYNNNHARLEPLHPQDEVIATPTIIPEPSRSEAHAPGTPDPELAKTGYTFTPPTMGGTLTANLPTDHDVSSVESIVNKQHATGPILSHDGPPAAPVVSQAPMSAEPLPPEPEPAPPAQSAPVQAEPLPPSPPEPAPVAQPTPAPVQVSGPTTTDNHPGLDAALLPPEEAVVPPTPAAAPPTTTLADLEKQVHGQAQTAASPPTPGPTLEAALQILPPGPAPSTTPQDAKDMPPPVSLSLPPAETVPPTSAPAGALAPPPPVPPPISGV